MRIGRQILLEIRISQYWDNPITLVEVGVTITPEQMRIGGSGTGGKTDQCSTSRVEHSRSAVALNCY